jgi:hypothetical protein
MPKDLLARIIWQDDSFDSYDSLKWGVGSDIHTGTSTNKKEYVNL